MMSDKYSEFYKLRVSDYTRYDTLSIHAILDILQDMIVIATNKAMEQVDAAMESAMGQYGSMFNGLF